MSPNLDAQVIASSCRSDPKHPDVQLGQTEHRINLVLKWNIREHDNVLELGCGQGDCTAVLATAVGEGGHVTAVDPAPPDYGLPWNMEQSHAFLKASAVGHRITFHQADTLDFLTSTNTVYDVAVLAHCIWYFSSVSALLATLEALSTRAKKICLAEYALATSDITSVPHILAAMTRASVECRKSESDANIRTVVSPRRVKEIATEAGLVLTDEESVLGDEFDVEMAFVKDERERAVVEALKDATRASKQELTLAGLKVSTMDIWYGILRRR